MCEPPTAFLDHRNETAWHTNLDTRYAEARGPLEDAKVLRPLESMLRAAARRLLDEKHDLVYTEAGQAYAKELVDPQGRLLLPPGGLQDMAKYNFAIVKGGAWRDGDELW